jgi:hypothetical protein
MLQTSDSTPKADVVYIAALEKGQEETSAAVAKPLFECMSTVIQ